MKFKIEENLRKINLYWIEENGGDIDDKDDWLDESEVVFTQETIAMFQEKWGEGKELLDENGRIWHGVQKAEGKTRGDLIVIDLGDYRVVYFGGEK